MNDGDREEWVNNVESLYLWWKGSGLRLREFIRRHRAEIDVMIQAYLAGRR